MKGWRTNGWPGRMPPRLTAAGLACALVTSGCAGLTGRGIDPGKAESLAERLVVALAVGDISSIEAIDQDRAVRDHEQVIGSMGALLPNTSLAGITYKDGGRTADVLINQEYAFPQGSWTFQTHATLRHDDTWLLDWSPSIVHPQLSATTRLRDERSTGVRGTIRDAAGTALVENRTVYKVGIDKSQTDPAQWEPSARSLAGLLDVDPDQYAAQVLASGPLAFVSAITLREGRVPSAIASVPGAAAVPSTLPLAPDQNFARGLLGISGEAPPEVIAKSKGEIITGDIVGLSGVQMYQDSRLRGIPGHTITISPRTPEQLSEMGQLPSSEPAPSTNPGTPQQDHTVYSVAAVDGSGVNLTLNSDLQRRTEELLSRYEWLVMAVVLDRHTGAILAAANSPAAGANSFATTGAYPPGSTLKVVTALALLRRGYTPDSPVNCSKEATVDGRIFTNFPGYPPEHNGVIPLRDAVAQSCNTAFINASVDMSDTELASAAASLGLSVDHDSGFDAFYGSIPTPPDVVTKASNNIGQGLVQMSPMAMAGMAASVSSGETKIPYLISDQVPTSTAQPLTGQEASMLQDIMASVVASGTLTHVSGVLQGGKSGTSEFSDDITRNHIWTVGYTEDYAITVMDYESHSWIPNEVIKALLG